MPRGRGSWVLGAGLAFGSLIAALIFISHVPEALALSLAEASVGQIVLLCVVSIACFVLLARFVLRARAVPRAGWRSTRLLGARRATRIAVIGSQESAVALAQELMLNRVTTYRLIGCIVPAGARAVANFPTPQTLGPMRDVASLVERQQIDLLLIGSDVPRLEIFDQLVMLADLVPVRVCELSAFYEDTFGHIPVAAINSAWFQYVIHPKFHPTRKGIKRAFDIAVSAGLGAAMLPLLLLAAILIKIDDGGRVLYRQRRIGENGRPFTLYKLRTMRERPDGEAQRWCSVGDPRVTRVGGFLRKLHIDELPQLYNVLRDEMSLVGPRPEQPEIVSRLEALIPFYSRRHLVKPGIAGWAQLRCGYVRSERGSAWKLCHDLYYLKHRSLSFDILILVRTFVMLGARLVIPERSDVGVRAAQVRELVPPVTAASTPGPAVVDSSLSTTLQDEREGRPAAPKAFR